MKKRDDAYRTNDVEELRPKPGYGAPFTPGFTISRNGPVYTSGTLNEALTGNYYNYRPNLSLSGGACARSLAGRWPADH